MAASSQAVAHRSAPQYAEKIIRRRTHELYAKRGRQGGHAEEDCLRAEAEVLGTVFKQAKPG
jgi:hypothetical protein